MRTPKSPKEFGFTGYDRQRLEKALHATTDKRSYQRIQAVHLFAKGMDVHTIAGIVLSSVRAIYKWIRLYLNDHQPLALYDASRTGRPVAAPQIMAEQILQELKSNPLDFGYNTTVWTVERLTEHLCERYSCQLSPFTLYRRMKQMGLRCKRPRYVYAEKDPNRAQKKGRLSAN